MSFKSIELTFDKCHGSLAVLGLFRGISTFLATGVSQNVEITRKGVEPQNVPKRKMSPAGDILHFGDILWQLPATKCPQKREMSANTIPSVKAEHKLPNNSLTHSLTHCFNLWSSKYWRNGSWSQWCQKVTTMIFWTVLHNKVGLPTCWYKDSKKQEFYNYFESSGHRDMEWQRYLFWIIVQVYVQLPSK